MLHLMWVVHTQLFFTEVPTQQKLPRVLRVLSTVRFIFSATRTTTKANPRRAPRKRHKIPSTHTRDTSYELRDKPHYCNHSESLRPSTWPRWDSAQPVCAYLK